MKRYKLVGLLFVVLSVLAAGSVQAAGPVTYTDEPGDSLDGRASMDIVRVTHDMRQVNKSGPPSLVFEMELAAPPETGLASYFVMTEIEGCGRFYASYKPGGIVWAAVGLPAAGFYHACADGDGASLPATFRVEGNVLRWAVALDSLPKDQRSGLTLSALQAFSQIAEPATGIMGTGWLDGTHAPGKIDAATSDKTWSF